MKDLTKLEERLDYTFKNKDLLEQSLVHRSYLNENPGFKLGQNERLEFLGDAVMEIIVTEYLFHKFPDTPEGEMTDWRASLVNAKMMAQVARELDLESHLYLSRGEAKDSQTKARLYILANAMEAVIGAIYLDGGMEAAKKFITKELLHRLSDIIASEAYIDPKSKFQEKAQELYNITPIYKIISESGPDHDKVFKVGLYLKKDLIAVGEGSSKQEAQVDAASQGIKTKNW